MADSSGAGISRRRLLITCVLLAVGVLITSGLLGVGVRAIGTSPWQAAADPGFKPPDACGKENDPITPRLELWKAVKDHFPPPANPSPNIFVNESWALKDGGQGKHDLLAIPRARVTGVECADIWGPKAFNLWKPAWDEAAKRFTGIDVMLGINSFHGRKQDQLHIHLTGFQQHARNQLNGLKGIPTDPSKWNTSMYSVLGHVYRIVRVNDLDANVFKLVKDHISQNDMFQQSIAVVSSAPNKGFYILSTQGKPDPGEPEHNPELRIGKDFGTEAIEDLIWRG
jgi:CDP-diacylglycerol pyrophosphatase